MNKQPSAKEIADAEDEAATACRALWAAQDRKAPYAERAALRRRLDAACQRCNNLLDAFRKAFAEKHGWRLNPRGDINYNYPVLDHVENYVDAKGKRVARVTHSYAPFEDIQRFARANNLIAQRLPFSWWNPRPECIAVLLMPPATNEDLL